MERTVRHARAVRRVGRAGRRPGAVLPGHAAQRRRRAHRDPRAATSPPACSPSPSCWSGSTAAAGPRPASRSSPSRTATTRRCSAGTPTSGCSSGPARPSPGSPAAAGWPATSAWRRGTTRCRSRSPRPTCCPRCAPTRTRSCSPTACPAGVQLDDLADVPAMHLAELLASRLERVNPRHRRLVIPVALVALLLIVVVAAVRARPMSEPLLRALTRMRGHLLDPDALVKAVASGRQKGQQPRWQRVELRYVDLKAGPPPAGHGVRRHPGAHRQPRRSATRPRDAVDALLDEPFGNWHVDTTTAEPPAAGDQEARGASCTPPTGRAEVEVDRGHDRDKARLLPEDDPVFAALGLSDAAGPDQAEPAGEVPPGRGVPAAARRLDHRRARQGPPAPADRRGPAADRRPRLRQRLPDLRRAALPDRGPRAAGAAHRRRRQGAVARAQQRGGRRARRRRGVRGRHDRRRRSSTRRPRWCSPCTPATPPPTRRSPARSSGRRRWCWPRPAATTTSPPSCARRPRPRRTPCSPGTASCASGSPTP